LFFCVRGAPNAEPHGRLSVRRAPPPHGRASACRAALRASVQSMPRTWFPKSWRAHPSWGARRARASGQGAPSNMRLQLAAPGV